MAKLTMLQLVQRTLSMVDADNVTTIGETVESEQVAEIVKIVYEDIMTDFPWYHKREYIQLEVTSTAHIMRMPGGLEQMLDNTMYYDDQPVYWTIPENMNDRLTRMDKTLGNVDANGALNDTRPRYWSSFDDENVIFDAYDGSLVSAKTSVWAAIAPSTPSVDTDVPDMPHNLHIALQFGVLAEAFNTLKGDLGAGANYERKKIKKVAKAKRFGRRTGQEFDAGQNIDYARRNISSSNEISSRNVIEGS